MRATIISIGSELTTGQTVDTNAAWLSAALTRYGAEVVRHVTVGDLLKPIQAAVREAMRDAELVVLTGGLGPTPDDLTRQAVADAVGQPLELNEKVLGEIQALFDRIGRTMHESNELQAMIPRGAEAVPNARGTAPGIRLVRDDVHLFALPGVPGEMMAMFESAVRPVVEAKAGGARTVTHQLHCFGVSESRVGELLHDLMQPGRNPAVGTSASSGIITIRMVSRGRAEADPEELVNSDVATIRSRLGAAVFGAGDDTLESVVAHALVARQETLSTAESCTGGLLAKRITDVPGSSTFFRQGYVTYSNTSKSAMLGVLERVIDEHGAVSERVASAMASGCRTAAGTDLALAITGIAGPAGGDPPEKPVGLVYIALAHGDRVEVKRLTLGEHLTRTEIRDRSSSAALNLLRLRLMEADRATD